MGARDRHDVGGQRPRLPEALVNDAKEIGRWQTSLLPAVLAVALVAVGLGLAWRGWGYYVLPLDLRVEHEDYRVLGPGGVVGHGYGIVGTALIVLNLLYLVRRKLAKLPLGSMRVWLDMHAFTGLVGGMLVLFHSAFQMRTPIANLSAVSLVVVVLTGVLGRFLHWLAPGADDAALEEQLHGLDAVMPGLAQRIRAALAAAPATRLDDATLMSAIATIPTWARQRGARRRAVREIVSQAASERAFDGNEYALFHRMEARAVRLAGRGATAAGASALLRTWRGLHRLLAIVMLLTVPVHIGVAWLYGYRWIWSE